MYRLKVKTSNEQPVFVGEKEIEQTVKEWYLKQVSHYSEQCMDVVKILLVLSIGGIAAVPYVFGQMTLNIPSYWQLVPQTAFGLCILTSSATYFPIGLMVSADVDARRLLRKVVLKDYATVAIAVFFFCVGIGLTVALPIA